MNDDLIKRLRNGVIEHKKRWSGDTHADLGGSVDYEATENLMAEAAARIAELEATLAEAASAWEAFKGATVSSDHFASVARLDAALGTTTAE